MKLVRGMIGSSLLAGCLFAAFGATGCSKAKSGTGKQPAPGGPSYQLEVKAPGPAKVGETVHATLELTPKGPYKVNMEYPLKLTLRDPAGKEQVLRAKDAKKMSKSGVLIEAPMRPLAAGEHVYKGEFRCSVCTEEQCELKRKEFSWVVRAH